MKQMNRSLLWSILSLVVAGSGSPLVAQEDFEAILNQAAEKMGTPFLEVEEPDAVVSDAANGLSFYFMALQPSSNVELYVREGENYMLMLFNVKEGEYPPPPPKESVLKVVGEFIKEGFANKYIIFLWLTMGVTAFGGPVMGTYFNLYFTDANTGLGLSTAKLGQLLAMGTGIGMVLIIPCGWFVDRYGPKRMWGISCFAVGVVQVLMFFVAKDMTSISILYCIFAAVNTVTTAALLPLMYAFIPKDKFGQLSGSNRIVTSMLQFVAVIALGWMITLSGENYSGLFIFGGIAYMLTPLFMWLMLKQPYPYGDLKTSMDPDGLVGQLRKSRASNEA